MSTNTATTKQRAHPAPGTPAAHDAGVLPAADRVLRYVEAFEDRNPGQTQVTYFAPRGDFIVLDTADLRLLIDHARKAGR